MHIVIHGATNLSNFGDILFAHLFYNESIKNGYDTDFYSGSGFGIGEFCRKELQYYKKCKGLKFLGADAMVLMSGGYFGEDKHSLKNTIVRYFRFFFPARLFQLTKKPIYVLGVGGGPVYSKFLKKVAVKILNYAKLVYVRDEETKKYFKEYGCSNDIKVTSDTALCISADNLPTCTACDEKLAEIRAVHDRGEKVILLHALCSANMDEKVADRVVPALNRFLENHKNYHVVVSTDGLFNGDLRELKTYKLLNSDKVIVYNYSNSLYFCKLINEVDFVVTMKLHVGIIASNFGKSVVSFPIHIEKVGRFYRQIREAQRSKRLEETESSEIYDMMEEYYDKPIVISSELRQRAQCNLDALGKIGEKVRENVQ